MKAPKTHTVHDHRPALLPVPSAALQHRCCLHQDAVPAEFAVIAAEVLDCFATAVYAAPIGLRDLGQLRFECALVLDEDDHKLHLRLRCGVEGRDGRVHPMPVETPAVLFIMAAVRSGTLYKQLDVSPVVCNDDLTCEFGATYPGRLTLRDLPGLGDKTPEGEPCWPTSVLRAPLPTPKLAMHARAIINWLRRGPESTVH